MTWWTSGPGVITDFLLIKLVSPGPRLKKSVVVNLTYRFYVPVGYNTSTHDDAGNVYSWVFKEWTNCSVPCDGGILNFTFIVFSIKLCLNLLLFLSKKCWFFFQILKLSKKHNKQREIIDYTCCFLWYVGIRFFLFEYGKTIGIFY